MMKLKSLSALLFSAACFVGCTSLLGDDFQITAGAGAGSGVGGAGVGGQAVGGAGGGGGAAPAVVPLSCGWKPGSIRRVASLETATDGDQVWDGRIRVAAIDHGLRLFMSRNMGVDGQQIEMWTVDDRREAVFRFPGNSIFQTRRAGAANVAVLYGGDTGLQGKADLRLAVFGDTDFDGSKFAGHQQLTKPFDAELGELDAAFVPTGRALGAFGEIAVVATYRTALNKPFAAYHFRWSVEASVPTNFFEKPGAGLGKDDFRIVELLRGSSNRSHLLLGSRFDGAKSVRQFVLPDALSSQVAPERLASDLMLRIAPRSAGGFLAAHAEINATKGTLALHLGELSEAELLTHTTADLQSLGEVGTLADVPQDGEFVLTDKQLILLGRADSAPKEMSMLLGHVSGAMRFRGKLPFPNDMPLPAKPVEIKAVNAVVSDGLFDQIGGDMQVVWVISAHDASDKLFDTLYYGQLSCSAQQ